jgi:diguanylate cyclase (GGDEF)-like protein
VRSRRFGRGLSLVFFDIDDFGQFNASYGHTLGDRLLRSVAMTISGAIELPELVARYGGDDFAVLLPEADRATAVEVTSKIVDRISDVSVFESPSGERQYVSVSAAIVSFPEDGRSREELLAAAEMSLEQSKSERRAMMQEPRQLTAVQQWRMTGRRNTA